MKTAAQIMKGKAHIREELERKLSGSQSRVLWERATMRLETIRSAYADLSGGVRMHTDHFIFPAAAVYLTVKDAVGQPIAYQVIEESAIRHSLTLGRKLAGLMKLPGMKSLFVSIWNPLTKKIFGPNSGFRNVFYPKKKGEYRMDIVECPYCRYFTALGCPELTKIFCENDERTYGNLPGIQFLRTTTLGAGGKRCDFCIRKMH